MVNFALSLNLWYFFRVCRMVYNWQYINCLRVWARLLARKGKKGQDLEQVPLARPKLGHWCLTNDSFPCVQLVYPFIHLVLGVIRLQPTPRFYPLRFICLRFLLEVDFGHFPIDWII